MNNFIYHNPTELVFGKGQIARLPKLIPADKRIMVTFGGGSVKRNGVYDQVVRALEGRDFIEFWGIEANPSVETLRKAIALGIKDSLEIIQETGVGNDEANQLFMFTQWSEMMTEFARTGKTSTVVLPSDFSQSASMFEQMLTAGKVQNGSKE